MRQFEDYIKENTLKDDSNNEFDLSIETIEKYYNKFNTLYFNDKLPEVDIELTTLKDTDNKYAIGEINVNIDKINRKVKVDKLIINVNRINSFIGFRNTLVHEMLHFYVILNYPPSTELWNKLYNYIKIHKTIDNSKINEILQLTDKYAHKGKWLEMANELNKEYSELNITEYGNDDKTFEKDFIDVYINKYRLYLQIKNYDRFLYVLKNNSDKLNEIDTAINCEYITTKDYLGEWYELEIIPEENTFNNFIVKYDLLSETICKDQNKIDKILSLKYFNKKYLGKVEQLKLTEQTLTNVEVDKILDQLEPLTAIIH